MKAFMNRSERHLDQKPLSTDGVFILQEEHGHIDVMLQLLGIVQVTAGPLYIHG